MNRPEVASLPRRGRDFTSRKPRLRASRRTWSSNSDTPAPHVSTSGGSRACPMTRASVDQTTAFQCQLGDSTGGSRAGPAKGNVKSVQARRRQPWSKDVVSRSGPGLRSVTRMSSPRIAKGRRCFLVKRREAYRLNVAVRGLQVDATDGLVRDAVDEDRRVFSDRLDCVANGSTGLARHGSHADLDHDSALAVRAGPD